jgi:hypothetical protein
LPYPRPLAVAAFPNELAVAWPSFQTFMGGWVHKMSIFSPDTPWNERQSKLVWRGTTGKLYGRGRSTLFDAVRHCQNLTDVQSTGDFHGKQWTHNRLNLTGLMRYKYSAYTTGGLGAYSWRLPELLAHFVVFMEQDTPAQHMPWFGPFLRPWVHYIPVRPNFVDLATKIRWATANDEQARRIHDNSRHFIQVMLKRECISTVMKAALSSYGQVSSDTWDCPRNCLYKSSPLRD